MIKKKTDLMKPPKFSKKKPDLKLLSQDRNKFEHQSKQMVSSSIFPHPSSILPSFDETFENISEKFFKTYPTKNSNDGERLLTMEQIEELKRLIIKEREDILRAKYTNIRTDFNCRHDKAINAKV